MSFVETNAAELLRACLDTGEVEAWAEFIRRYQPVIAGVIGRIVGRYSSGSSALADDLVQETYLRLCRNGCKVLREFAPERDEAVFGFLKVVTSSVALDHFRAQAATKRGPEPAPLDNVTERFAISQTPAADGAAQRAELWRHMEQVAQSERDITIFRMYYQQGFSTREIAALPAMRLSAKGVESCLHRIVADLRQVLRETPPQKGKSQEISFGGVR